MAYNYIDLDQKITYYKERLDLLGRSVQNPTTFRTEEAYIAECNRVLKSFYERIDEPFFNYQEASQDHGLHPVADGESTDYSYNKFWEQLLDNLILLFTQMENLESLSIANYNFAVVEMSDLTARLKLISSKLGDYMLYSKNTLKDILLVRDSFNNLLRIDSGSSLVTSEECNVDQEEGIVTLPRDSANCKTISIPTDGITITPAENAFAGNNHDIVRTAHNSDIAAMVDNNPDTWFEFERVVAKNEESPTPLVMNISLNLGEPKIVNHIIINPNNFGTRTVLNIESIDTSLDGQTFTSIKDDIPIVGYEVEDEENIFRLAPSTSKFAGQGVYTFTPRKVQFVKITLKQNEPYVILTTGGEKLRYAIGLRDITLKSLAFKGKGEILSKPFTVNDEIKKVMLEVTQTPVVDSELTNIKYFISHDDGVSWNQIQPKHLSALSGIQSTVPEIVNFNTSDSNSISTSVVKSIRLKIQLEREDGNFVEGSSSLAKRTATKSEVHAAPGGSPNIIKLENSPVQDANGPKIEIVDSLFGSMGLPDSVYMLKYGTVGDETTFTLPKEYRKVELPLKKDNNFSILFTDYEVYVGGEKWSHVQGPFSDYPNEPKFKIEHGAESSWLKFDDDEVASVPPESSSVGIGFGPERIFPTADSDNHKATLHFKTTRTKDSIYIDRFEEPLIGEQEQVPFGASRFNTSNKNIEVTEITGMAVGTDEAAFINGRDEFEGDANKKYSVDEIEGVIYFSQPVSASTVTTVKYNSNPVTRLSSNDWEWGENTASEKYQVIIKESGWKTRTNSKTYTKDQDNAHEQKQFHLPNLGLISGTLRAEVEFEGETSSPNPFYQEPQIFTTGTSQLVGVPADAPKWTYDPVLGKVYISHEISNLKSITFTYEWANFQMKYPIGRSLKYGIDYSVDVPNKQISINDNEFLGSAMIAHATKSGKTGYYLVNYDYVSETREGIEELKDYFTPVVKDYVLKILRSIDGNLKTNSAIFPNNTEEQS